MEFTSLKVRRRCKRKIRSSKRIHDFYKVKVRAMKQHERVMLGYVNAFGPGSTSSAMQADAFWRNYAVAQEWQRRHHITWWRSRCMALEHENEALRNKIRSLVRDPCPETERADNVDHADCYEENNDDTQDEMERKTDEDLEFNITEDMLSFFEQSERHRRELRKHESKGTVLKEETPEETAVGGAEIARARKEEASLLYGDEASKILAMETALQATVDNYRDKAKPQYWPNIPLKP